MAPYFSWEVTMDRYLGKLGHPQNFSPSFFLYRSTIGTPYLGHNGTEVSIAGGCPADAVSAGCLEATGLVAAAGSVVLRCGCAL